MRQKRYYLWKSGEPLLANLAYPYLIYIKTKQNGEGDSM